MSLIKQYGSFGPGCYGRELDRANSTEWTAGWQLNGCLPVLADMAGAPVCWPRKRQPLGSGHVWSLSRGSEAQGPKASSGGLLTVTQEAGLGLGFRAPVKRDGGPAVPCLWGRCKHLMNVPGCTDNVVKCNESCYYFDNFQVQDRNEPRAINIPSGWSLHA